MSHCEGGLQNVKVTRVYKKKMDLMFFEENYGMRYLDDVVTPPAFADTYSKCCVQWLVQKLKEA